MYQDLYPLVSPGGLAAGSTGDKVTFPIPFKCEVRRTWATPEGTDANAVGFVLKFDSVKQGTRADGDVGVVTKPASVNHQGKYLYEDPLTRVILNEGDYVVGEITTAQGAALAFQAGILIERIPERPANQANMVSA